MLSHISITSFRGIDNVSLTLGKRTYIMGANGSWKTHVLDAIHILAWSRPLYGETSLESWTQFEGIFCETDLGKSYRIIRDDVREYFVIQGAKHTKPKYMKALPWRTVHISPFDMNLLYFAPSMRRDYIDLILSRTHDQFSGVRRDYDLVMRQRNAMLKKIREGLAKREDLDFWDQKFAECADLYGMYRSRYSAYVTSAILRFPDFFGKYSLSFHYESNWINEDDRCMYIAEYLHNNRERDILTWHTHIGPHRDDWGFRIATDMRDINVESYLSRGEMKMILLWLKMIEVDYISTTLDFPVILLIDDIFAELDDDNSEIFLNSLMQHQVILTSQKPLPNHEKYHDFICINLSNA
jgi:DNA replication and repair protein RecF